MDVFFPYRGLTFVWDDRKAMENLAKHGIPFETACEAFFDPSLAHEDASVEGESRVAVIGTTAQDDLVYVVHVEWEELYLRIISAREATRRERRIYEDGR